MFHLIPALLIVAILVSVYLAVRHFEEPFPSTVMPGPFVPEVAPKAAPADPVASVVQKAGAATVPVALT